MSTSDHRPKIAVEDLLRLKRAERPEASFWANFETELRQKQLSALLERRSWWQNIPQLFSRRAYLPIGATAILTFSLVSVKYYYPIQLTQSDGGSLVETTALNYSSGMETVSAAPVAASLPMVNRHEQALVPQQAQVSALSDAQVSARDSSIPHAAVRIDYPTKESPSARSIAANLAHLEQSEPELINAFLGSRLSLPVRVQAASAPSVELASIPVNNSKRNRLLAHYTDRQLNTEPTAPDAVRERLSRRLGDSDFNDRFSRFGLKGDQVSLKF